MSSSRVARIKQAMLRRRASGRRSVLTAEALEPRLLLSVWANADGPYAIDEGSDLILDGSDSGSLLPPSQRTFQWDLNDDGVFETNAGGAATFSMPWSALEPLALPSNGTGLSIALKYTAQGKILGFPWSGSDTDSAQLVIRNVAPTADAGGPYEVREGEALILDASGSTDPDRNDVLRYEWDMDNDGQYDGPHDVNAGAAPFVVIAWSSLEAMGANDGTPMHIGLRVSDDDGGASEAAAAAEVTIIDVKPRADVGGPYAIREGEDLHLSGMGWDPNANDYPLTYAWDVNGDHHYGLDGQDATVPWWALEHANLPNDGTPFVVSLRVTDAKGVQAYDDGFAVISNRAPRQAEAGGPYVISEGDDLHLRGSAEDPGGDHLGYLWDLDGDGAYDDAAGKDTKVPWEALEKLVNSDTWPWWDFGKPLTNSTPVGISMQVSDGEGGVGYDSAWLTIRNVDPTADADGGCHGSYTIDEGQDLWLDASGSSDPDANDPLTYIWSVKVGGHTRLLYMGDDPVVRVPWQKLESAGVPGNDDPLTLKLTVLDGAWFGCDIDTADLIVRNVAPTADAGGPYVIHEGQDVQLTGSGSDPNANDALTYDWDINGDGTYDILNQQGPLVTWATLHDTFHLASDNRSLVMALRVTDSDGGEGVDRAFLLEVINDAPAVNAGGPYTISEGDNLPLNASGSDPGQDPLTYRWDLDHDGVFDDAAGANPTVAWFTLKQLRLHTNGTTPNTIVVLADDGQGGLNVATATLIIKNVAPTPEAGPDQTLNEGSQAIFFGSFTDPYGENDGPFAYAWDFGDGSAVVHTLNAAHTYLDNGAFTVRFTVTDKDGGANTDTLAMTVLNVAPDVDAGEDKVAEEGEPVAFSGQFTDPGVNDTFTFLWEFGDGGTANALNALHTYADNGTYTARLTVTDDDGGVGYDELTTYVQNEIPKVYAGPYVGIDEGQTVQFMGAFWDVNIDMTNNPTIQWDFGDGVGLSGILNPTHTYLDDGVYTARLTVTDKDGGASSDQVAVIVYNVAPAVSAGGEFLADTGPANSDALADTAVGIAFHGSFTDPGILDTHTIQWDFGDGAKVAGTLNPTHEYEMSGIYTVALTVTDKDGGATTDTIRLAVQEKLAIVKNAAFLHTTAGLLKVSLRGPGSLVEVNHINGIDTDFNSVVVNDTTEKSALGIKTIGRRSFANLGDVIVHSSLGKLTAPTTNLLGDVQIGTGSLGAAVLASMDEESSITTGLGGIQKVKVRNDIEGLVHSAASIDQVMTQKGSLTGTASIVADTGSVGKLRFGKDLAGMVLAATDIGTASGGKGVLTGTLRAGGMVGKVKFYDIQHATVSSGGDLDSVVSRTSIVDSLLLAGFDIGPDGRPGTGDEVFNPGGATINLVQVNLLTGNFDNSYAMAGVEPYQFTATMRRMLAPDPAAQQLASFGAIGKATLGQVFQSGDPNVGVYGLFAATQEISNVKFTPITASGAPAFETRWNWL